MLFTCLTTPEVVEEILLQAAEGARFLEAPVSGGPWGAEQGTLAIMCGGDQAVFEEAKPLLACMGKNLYLLGPLGSGAVAKLCNNLLVAIHTAAAAEAFVLGTRAPGSIRRRSTT